MQEIWDLLISIPYRIGYLIVDFIQWVLSLVPSVPFDLQGMFNGLPADILNFASYMNLFAGLAIIASAYSIRAILMIFGR